MVTFVGTQDEFDEAISELCQLEKEIIDVYKISINHMKNDSYNLQLIEFSMDHEKQYTEFLRVLKKNRLQDPTDTLKNLLVPDRMVLNRLHDDKSILQTVLYNEEDIKIAYNRLSNHKNMWEDSRPLLQSGLYNERKFIHWIKQTLTLENAL